MFFSLGKQFTTTVDIKCTLRKISIIESDLFVRIRALLILFLLSFSSCTGVNLRSWPLPISPNTHPSQSYAEGGVLFKGGVFYHMDSTVLYSGSGILEKTGRACSYSILYLIAFGSSRIYDAKVNGAVRSIGLIEEEILAILGGAFHRHCTIVVGDSK